MTDGSQESITPRQQERILEQLDKMVRKGRMTEGEARRLREATGAADFESVIRDVRSRHAGTKVDAAVKDGSMTREEADNVILSIKKGEHSRSLRAHLRHLVPGKRPGK